MTAEDRVDHVADVLVLGGGPAGAATALALLRRGVPRVLLVDRPARAPFAVGESAAPNVGALLEGLGLPGDLGLRGHLPYHGNLSLWGGPEPVVDDFLRRGQGHGWHLDRAAFDAWLRASAVSAGASLLRPAELASVERADRGWRVRLRHAGGIATVRAAILVDASGRKAALARRLGVRRRRLDGLVALAALADPTRGAAGASLAGLSLVEPVADGWWYAAGLPSGRVMLTLMTDGDLARAGGLREAAAYRQALATTSQVRGAAGLPEGFVVASLPAGSQYLDRAVGPGWLAVGDALLGLDPLTSSGITGALDDGRAAAETIVAWLGARDGAAAIEAAHGYARRAEATLRRYLAEHRAWYGRERRWAQGPFWLRRAG